MITFSVYIAECSDGTLYTGIAKDVHARILQHNTGMGAKYTKARRPVRLVYSCTCDSRSAALKREYEIKQLTRAEKLALIATTPKQ